jgi:hypothetical protein
MKAPDHKPICNAQPLLPEPDKEAWSAPTIRLLNSADTRSGKGGPIITNETTTEFRNMYGNAS